LDSIFNRFCKSTKEISVDEADLSVGDRKELHRLLADFNHFVLQHAFRQGKDADIHIGFFQSRAFTARASYFEGSDVIAISWEIVTALREEFAGAVNLPGLDWIEAPYRDAAARWLYTISIHSVFLHEFSHVWNGHTRLLDGRGVAFIDEAENPPEDRLSLLERRTLEFDADSFAGTNVVTFSQSRNLLFPFVNPSWDSNFGDGVTSMVMAAFAMHSVFRRFNEAAEFDHSLGRIHPAAPLRQRIIAETMARHAEEKYDYLEGSEVMLWGARLAENVRAQRIDAPLDDAALQATLGPEWVAFRNDLLRCWHTLRPQLDAFKLGGELAATQEVDDDAE